MPQSSAARQRSVQTLATVGLVILVIGCLYWAKPVLVPTALAILFAFLLSPVVTWLQKRRVPRVPAVILVVVVTGLFVLGMGALVGNQILNLANQLPSYKTNVIRRVSQFRERSDGSLLSNLEDFAKDVAAAAEPSEAENEAAGEPAPVRVIETKPGWDLSPLLAALGPLLEPVATAGLVIVLVVYMLLNREDVRNRALSLVGQGQLVVTTRALDDAGQRIGRYLLAQLCLNVGFGFFIGIGLTLIGLPHALLWGVLAALLRYIPMLGPWLAAIFPLALSLLISPGWGQPIMIVLLFVAFELTSNLVVEPWLYGQSIGVAQAPLLIAIAFWTWLWGPIGLVLAAPLTVCLVVLGKYVPQLKFFDLLLGDQPPLTADLNFYQRLLANDQDEASDIAREQLLAHSLAEACDRIFIPAIIQSKRDLASGMLSEPDADFVIQATQEIADEQGLAAAAAEEFDFDAQVEPATPRMTLLACAAVDKGDTVVASMLSKVLDPSRYEVRLSGIAALASEIVARVEAEEPHVVCIAALPPGGLTRTRLLCKRLRSRFPQLKILVGRWGLSTNVEENRTQLKGGGADDVHLTFAETLEALDNMTHVVRSTAVIPEPHTPRQDDFQRAKLTVHPPS